MIYVPTVPIPPCRSCSRQPEMKHRWFRGARMECSCGVAGPFVSIGLDTPWPEVERRARAAWCIAFPGPAFTTRPPPPKGRDTFRPGPDEPGFRRVGPPTPRAPPSRDN